MVTAFFLGWSRPPHKDRHPQSGSRAAESGLVQQYVRDSARIHPIHPDTSGRDPPLAQRDRKNITAVETLNNVLLVHSKPKRCRHPLNAIGVQHCPMPSQCFFDAHIIQWGRGGGPGHRCTAGAVGAHNALCRRFIVHSSRPHAGAP